LIAAQYSGVEVEFKSNDQAPEDITQNPYAKIRNYDSRWPVLHTESGPIWGSTPSARYVASLGATHLTGQDQSYFAQSKVDQWIDFVNNEVKLPVISWIYPLLGFLTISPEEQKLVKRAAKQSLQIVDSHLLNNTFLVGERVTLADLVLFTQLEDLFTHAVEAKLAQKFRNLTRWFLTLAHTPQVTAVIGNPDWKAKVYYDQLVSSVVSVPQEVRDLPTESHAHEEAHNEVEAHDETHENAAEIKAHKEEKRKQVKARKELQIAAFKEEHIVRAAESLAQQIASRPSKKLTEKDLNSKAFASIYTPAKTPHEKIPRGATSPSNIRGINQPNNRV